MGISEGSSPTNQRPIEAEVLKVIIVRNKKPL